MLEADHEIYLDIFKIPFRPCRPPQERIADYYETGKPRFEWEKIYQKWIINQDPVIIEYCQNCPMNLFQPPLGCEGRLPGFKALLRILEREYPDSLLLKMDKRDNLLDQATTANLLEELKSINEILDKINWPVARVFFLGQPVYLSGLFRSSIPAMYPWDGSDEISYQLSNEGYMIGMTAEGIILRETTGELLPNIFRKIWREKEMVLGETSAGEILLIPPFNNVLPEWDQVDPNRESQLIATDARASEAFGTTIDILSAFCQNAVHGNTGVGIRSII